MSAVAEQPWIDAGYAAFAIGGPDALKVERLAREVGISKSSFYHHFADLPMFIERLHAHHLQRSDLLAEQAGRCTAFDPEFIELLVANRMDILFQRQLRLRRSDAAYQRCFRTAHARVVDPIMPLWADALGIPGQLEPAREMLDVVTDVFYQRLTNDNLSYPWMVALLEEIEVFIRHATRSKGSIRGLGKGQS